MAAVFSGKRRLLAVTPLAKAFAIVVTLVADRGRPQSGFIIGSQQAMADVQATMRSNSIRTLKNEFSDHV